MSLAVSRAFHLILKFPEHHRYLSVPTTNAGFVARFFIVGVRGGGSHVTTKPHALLVNTRHGLTRRNVNYSGYYKAYQVTLLVKHSLDPVTSFYMNLPWSL